MIDAVALKLSTCYVSQQQSIACMPTLTTTALLQADCILFCSH